MLWVGVVAGAAIAVACSGSSDAEDPTMAATPSTPAEQLSRAYSLPGDPGLAAWDALLADEKLDTQSAVVTEFVRLKPSDGALDAYNAYVDALSAATRAVGGEMITVNDVLFPGIEGLEGYDGGVSLVASYPTMRAYTEALLSEGVLAAADGRREAVEEAQILLGPNLVPAQILQLPPNEPASAFPRDRVIGKTPEQIVDELLEVYPSGGADPTKETLEAIARFEGFLDQRVHFINLYRFKGGGGEESLGEYNAAALPSVLAHGGRPKALANVTHHLAGPTAWDRFILVAWPSLAVFTDLRLDPAYIEAQKDRVVSGEEYGNLVNIARADRPAE
jgi:uncharacterized protein (DUF1330 family)